VNYFRATARSARIEEPVSCISDLIYRIRRDSQYIFPWDCRAWCLLSRISPISRIRSSSLPSTEAKPASIPVLMLFNWLRSCTPLHLSFVSLHRNWPCRYNLPYWPIISITATRPLHSRRILSAWWHIWTISDTRPSPSRGWIAVRCTKHMAEQDQRWTRVEIKK